MGFSLGPSGLDHTHTGYSSSAPRVYNISGGTYYNGSGYTNQAMRLLQMPASGSHLFVGKLIKKGDFNYTGQNTNVDIMYAQWDQTTSAYELKCRGNDFHDTSNAYFWVDSSKWLWFWNNDQWHQQNFLVVYNISPSITIDCQTTTNDQHNWSGQTRYAVSNGVVHTREASYGD